MLLAPGISLQSWREPCCGAAQPAGDSVLHAAGPSPLMLGRTALRHARLMCTSPKAQAAHQLAQCREHNITWQEGAVSREAKEAQLQQRGCVVWFTGLSGSGKSTVACTLEHALHSRGVLTALLDGDNVRHGLNSNLGFSEADRAENIRRVGEITKLFVETGLITLASFISPYKRDRDAVRARVGAKDFIEVFMKIPLEVCEQRDAKGLYALARAGKIKGFTGVDDPYEPPDGPEITLEVEDAQGVRQTPEAMAFTILSHLQAQGYLKSKLANNAVSGPARAIADWSERNGRVPVVDYSI